MSSKDLFGSAVLHCGSLEWSALVRFLTVQLTRNVLQRLYLYLMCCIAAGWSGALFSVSYLCTWREMSCKYCIWICCAASPQVGVEHSIQFPTRATDAKCSVVTLYGSAASTEAPRSGLQSGDRSGAPFGSLQDLVMPSAFCRIYETAENGACNHLHTLRIPGSWPSSVSFGISLRQGASHVEGIAMKAASTIALIWLITDGNKHTYDSKRLCKRKQVTDASTGEHFGSITSSW